MRMTDSSTIPGLEGIYLEDSWVVGIVARPGVFEMTADLVLSESHPAYEPPRPGEQYCYRRGVLRFERVSTLTWEGQGAAPAVDASGEEDYGSIDSLAGTDGGYLIEGDFGRVAVSSVAPTVVFIP